MPGPVQLASGRGRAIWAFRVDGTILEDNMIDSSYLQLQIHKRWFMCICNYTIYQYIIIHNIL